MSYSRSCCQTYGGEEHRFPCFNYEPSEVPGPPTKREAVLDEAKALITGDRQAAYGDVRSNFDNTAAILNASGYGRFLPDGSMRHLNAADVAIIMLSLKLARLRGDGIKRDTAVDLAGYAALLWEVYDAPAE